MQKTDVTGAGVGGAGYGSFHGHVSAHDLALNQGTQQQGHNLVQILLTYANRIVVVRLFLTPSRCRLIMPVITTHATQRSEGGIVVSSVRL